MLVNYIIMGVIVVIFISYIFRKWHAKNFLTQISRKISFSAIVNYNNKQKKIIVSKARTVPDI